MFPGLHHRRDVNLTNGEELSPTVSRMFADSFSARLLIIERKEGGKGKKEVKFP